MLDDSTKEDIRKAVWALGSLGMSLTAQNYFDYQLRRLLVPAIDAHRRAWVIAWTNLRQDERTRAEIYNSFVSKEKAAAFKNLSGTSQTGRSGLGRLTGQQMSRVLRYM